MDPLDSTSIIMFVVPVVVALPFTLLAANSMKADKKRFDLYDFFCSLMAAIPWSIMGLTWPAVATLDMFVSVGWLWYGVSAIFFIYAFYVAVRMLGSIFETKKPPVLVLQNGDGEE